MLTLAVAAVEGSASGSGVCDLDCDLDCGLDCAESSLGRLKHIISSYEVNFYDIRHNFCIQRPINIINASSVMRNTSN